MQFRHHLNYKSPYSYQTSISLIINLKTIQNCNHFWIYFYPWNIATKEKKIVNNKDGKSWIELAMLKEHNEIVNVLNGAENSIFPKLSLNNSEITSRDFGTNNFTLSEVSWSAKKKQMAANRKMTLATKAMSKVKVNSLFKEKRKKMSDYHGLKNGFYVTEKVSTGYRNSRNDWFDIEALPETHS
jgi:hypothetical protein